MTAAAQVQPDVQDLRRRHRGRLRPSLPAAGDRPGHLRQLPERPRHHPHQAALRHRPDRQELPQRDHHQGNFIFRTREFEQMELEFFCEPGTDEQWYEHWKEQRFNWYTDLGIKKENLRFRDHAKDELAHYAKGCVDVEYRFPFGSGDWQELEGIANRTDFDLNAAQQGSAARTGPTSTRRPKEQLHPLRHRAVGRRRPGRAGASCASLRRGRGPRRQGRRSSGASCSSSTRASRPSRSPCCRCCKKAEPRRTGRRSSPPTCAASSDAEFYDDTAAHRPALPPPGRDRHALLRHGRLRDARRQDASPSATATR